METYGDYNWLRYGATGGPENRNGYPDVLGIKYYDQDLVDWWRVEQIGVDKEGWSKGSAGSNVYSFETQYGPRLPKSYEQGHL